MVNLPGFPFAQANAGEQSPAEAPDLRKPRRKLVPPGKSKAIDFSKISADMRGLNSDCQTAAEFQLAAAIAAAMIHLRDFGHEKEERRTLVTADFGRFFIEQADFPALVRKKWPGLSDEAVSLAWEHLVNIVKIERKVTAARTDAIRADAGKIDGYGRRPY